MGGQISVSESVAGNVVASNLTRKPTDASDVANFEEAKSELAALRSALVNVCPENHPAHVKAKIIADYSTFKAMMDKAPEKYTAQTFAVGCIADQDENARTKDGEKQVWETYLLLGALTSTVSEDGAVTYTATSQEEFKEIQLITERGDKKGRGAEYSLLHFFDGKLVTACDRTGNIDEIAIKEDGTYELVPVIDTAANEPLVLLKGDGSKKKALKCEWSAIKDGKLWIGSTGKERTNDDGSVSGQGEMWVKSITAGTWSPAHHDWIAKYNALRAVAKCEFGTGYFVNESGIWSDVHQRWFFMPRKLSREYYDEIKDCEKCCNLLISCDADFSPESIILQDVLTFSTLRGTADFKFVPGTNETQLMIIRTEESLDNIVSSYLSVVGLDGTIYMDEVKVAEGRKIEGIEFVQGWLDTATTKEA
eukprot:g3300.t1